MSAPVCPVCAWVRGRAPRGRVTTFRLDGGDEHAAPDIWIAGRALALERADPDADPITAYRRALDGWAEQCRLAARVAAQRAADVCGRVHPTTHTTACRRPHCGAAAGRIIRP